MQYNLFKSKTIKQITTESYKSIVLAPTHYLLACGPQQESMLELRHIWPFHIAEWGIRVYYTVLHQIPQWQNICRNSFLLQPSLAETQCAILKLYQKLRSMKCNCKRPLILQESSRWLEGKSLSYSASSPLLISRTLYPLNRMSQLRTALPLTSLRLCLFSRKAPTFHHEFCMGRLSGRSSSLQSLLDELYRWSRLRKTPWSLEFSLQFLRA